MKPAPAIATTVLPCSAWSRCPGQPPPVSAWQSRSKCHCPTAHSYCTPSGERAVAAQRQRAHHSGRNPHDRLPVQRRAAVHFDRRRRRRARGGETARRVTAELAVPIRAPGGQGAVVEECHRVRTTGRDRHHHPGLRDSEPDDLHRGQQGGVRRAIAHLAIFVPPQAYTLPALSKASVWPPPTASETTVLPASAPVGQTPAANAPNPMSQARAGRNRSYLITGTVPSACVYG